MEKHKLYYELNSVPEYENRYEIIQELKFMLMNLKHIKLGGIDGSGEPIFNTDKIVFNGFMDEANEPFCIDFNKPESKTTNTNKKPYDLIVRLTLLSISKNVLDFDFSSDDTYFDWDEALKLYRRFITDNVYKD